MSRVLMLVLVFAPAIAVADDPPPPNPDDPVDYVAWINTEYGEGIRDNAADDYLAAIAAFVDSEAAQEIWKERRDSAKWTPQDVDVLRGCVAANEECLNRFVAASAKRECYFVWQIPASGAMMDVRLPEMKPLRDIAKLLTMRASLQIADGEIGSAMDDACALLAAGRHFRAQPMLIQYLIGVAFSHLAYDVLLDLPQEAGHQLEYEKLLKRLRRVDRAPRPPTKHVATDKLMFWDVAQRWLRDADGDGKYEQWVVPPGAMFENGVTLPITPPMPLDDVVADASTTYGDWGAVFVRDYAEAEKLAERLSSQRQRHLQNKRMLGIIVPELWRAAQLHRKFIARRRATRVVLHFHAFHAAHGRWPQGLAEATKGESPSIRKDPFSGEEFLYRLKHNQPLLYSVGINGKDDGGKPSSDGKQWGEDGDAILWPPAGK